MDAISLILGVYAFTLVLTQSEGAWGQLYKLRNDKYVDDFGLLNCFICTSFWITVLICLFTAHWGLFFIGWGGAIIIDKVIK